MHRPQRPLVYALTLAAIVLLGFFLRVYKLDGQSLWYDESVTAQVVQQGVGELARWTADDIQPPLYYVVVAGWTQGAGLSEAALRLPSALFGVLMIALAFVLGKRLFGSSAGLLAALMAAVQPLWVYYSQEARMYTLLTALGMLAGYALLRVLAAAAAQNGYPKARLIWWTAFAAAAIALLYTHYFATFLLLAFAIYFLLVVLVHRGPQTVRLLAEGVAVTLVVGLAYLPWLPNALRRFGVDSSYWQGTLKLNEALRHIAISFTTGETVLEGQAIPLAWVVGIIALACLAALLVVVARDRRSEESRRQTGGEAPVVFRVRRSAVLFVLLYLLIPIAAILALSYRTPKFNPRYLMLASPALVLLLAGGLALPFSRPRTTLAATLLRIAAGVGILALLLISTYALRNWYTDPAFTKDDWRGAAAYIRSRIQPDESVVLVSGHAAPAWRYYAPEIEPVRLPELEILDVNAVLDGSSAAAALADGLAGKRGAWLVQWQEDVVDPTGVTGFLLERAGVEQPGQPSFWGLDQVRHFLLEPGTPLPDTLTPDVSLDADFGGQVSLLGYSQPACQPRSDGLPCPLYLFWQAEQPLSDDLKFTATLFDDYSDAWSAPQDRRLSAYDYPTFRWQPGETVLSRVDVAPSPGTPPGSYALRLGVYAQDGEGAVEPLDLLDTAGAPTGRWTTVPLHVDNLTPASVTSASASPLIAAPGIELLQVNADSGTASPGTLLNADLWWQARDEARADYAIRWEWLDPAGQPQAWGTKPVAGDDYPTSRWQPNAPVRSQLAVPAPADAQPGDWMLRLGLSTPDNPEAFAGDTQSLHVKMLATEHLFVAPPVQFAANQAVGDGISLVGISTVTDTVSPGTTLPVTVVWRAESPSEASYTAFVHLLDAAGNVVAQDDHLPLQGQRPTNGWLAGEIIVDQHTLTLPADLTPGSYRFEVGMYDGSRPDLRRPGEAVVLGQVEVR
ncbi:MAG: glycosyltransferase family 39 protein [Anaerolineales bacterium]|nr:glycosyltransferase family 39 protein [Anaerolineales bacterium]